MPKAKLVWCAGVAAVLGACALIGCAPQANDNVAPDDGSGGVPQTGMEALKSWQVEPGDDPSELYRSVYEGLAERAEENQPEIVTYDDGTSVQRTPNAALDSTLQVHDNISFNVYRLHADDRGCLACHDDLAETAANIAGYPHLDFTGSHNPLGIEWNVNTCKGCHVGHFATKYDEWSGLIHNIHDTATNQMFVEQGGTCWSCHYGETVGDTPGMSLWDDVKHEVMHGITAISSSNMTGEFSYTQDEVVDADGVYSYSYIRNHDNEEAGVRWAREYLGLKPDASDTGVYDEWNITIGGLCDNPMTITLSDLIEAVPSTTMIMQGQCVDNGPGGSLVSNFEVTGILVRDLMEYVGAQDGVNSVVFSASDGKTGSYPLDRVVDGDAIIGYEIGGEPLAYSTGYPVTLFTPGTGLDFVKELVDIEFSAEPGKINEAEYHGAHDLDGNNWIYPNVGICHLREGQIIPVGEPFTFQGYAAAINSGITSIEVSMDQGKTWQRYETPDNDWKRWTWWEYTWTPTEAGWYTITVRATADDGTVTYHPVEMMVTVQGEGEVD